MVQSADFAGETPYKDSGQRQVAAIAGFMCVALLFTASGFSSLIYQVVWTRMLVLVFGSTTFATATVLAVFMGGLAAGALLAARFADRTKRPFLWYGILEGVIGLFALLVPLLFDAVVPLYRWIWQQYHLNMLPLSLLRFCVVTVILLVPTCCMGATLPLLSRFVTRSLAYVGHRVGTLYSLNTLGAVLGAALAGFVMLPAIGQHATILIAGGINIALCIAVILTEGRITFRLEEPHPFEQASTQALTAATRTVTICFAVSGALAMIYEVCWTRALLMVIGSSIYAFTIMLCTFLLGIFAGSLLCAHVVDRAKQPILWFAALQFAVFTTSIIGMAMMNLLPWWNIQLNMRGLTDVNVALGARIILSGSILLPLTLCLGAIFPVVVKCCTSELSAIGRSAGTLYGANTAGAIAGAMLAGFALIPWLGVERTLIAAAAGNLILALMLLNFVQTVPVRLRNLAVIFCLVVAFLVPLAPPLWDRVVIMSAQQQRRIINKLAMPFEDYPTWRDWLHQNVILKYWKDGTSSSVGVVYYPSNKRTALITNGHIDASDTSDMPTQILLAAYPLLFKPYARDVAIIGWGSGVTCSAATSFPAARITAIELEPAVIEAGHQFAHVNSSPQNNSRVKIVINDGRNYLLATDRKFDVIVSEPSNPWQTGVCNLFTKEYFKICSDRLNQDGVLSLWLQIVEVPPENIRSILKSVQSVFSNVLVMRVDDSNVTLLASNEPIRADLKELSKLVTNPLVAVHLRVCGIKGVEDLLSRVLLNETDVEMLVQHDQPNVDDTNRLEFAVGKTYENKRFVTENNKLLSQAGENTIDLVTWNGETLAQRSQFLAGLSATSLMAGNMQVARRWAHAATKAARTAHALRITGIIERQQGHHKEAYSLWSEALELDPHNIEVLQTRGIAHAQDRHTNLARSDFNRVLQIEPNNRVAKYHLAQTYSIYGYAVTATPIDAQQVLACLGTLPDDAEFVKRHPDVLLMAGFANFQLGKPEAAKSLLRRQLQLQPVSISGSRVLGAVLCQLGQQEEASTYLFSSMRSGQIACKRLVAEAEQALSVGDETRALTLLADAVRAFPADSKATAMLRALAPRHPSAAALCRTLDVLMTPIYQDSKL